MSDLGEMLKAQSEAIARAYVNGHHCGYQEGFREGLAQAQKLIAKAFPEFVTEKIHEPAPTVSG